MEFMSDYQGFSFDDTDGIFDDLGSAVSSVVAPVSSIASSVVSTASTIGEGVLGTVGLGKVLKKFRGIVGPILKTAEKAASLIPGVGAPLAMGVSLAASISDKGKLNDKDFVRAARVALPLPARLAFDQAVSVLRGGKLQVPGLKSLSGPAAKVVRALANTPQLRSMGMKKLANLLGAHPNDARRAASHLISSAFALPEGDWIEVGEYDSFDTGAIKAKAKSGKTVKRRVFKLPKFRVRTKFLLALQRRNKKIAYAFKQYKLDPIAHGKKVAKKANTKGFQFDARGYWDTGAMDFGIPSGDDPFAGIAPSDDPFSSGVPSLPGGGSSIPSLPGGTGGGTTSTGKPLPIGFRSPNNHQVQSGETSSAIAGKYTGNSDRWRELREYNPEVVSFSAINTNMNFKLPPDWTILSSAPAQAPSFPTLPGAPSWPSSPGASPPSTGGVTTATGKPVPLGFTPPNKHRVQSGETSSAIAGKYTGNSDRWRELREYNQEVADFSKIDTSMVFTLPPDWIKVAGISPGSPPGAPTPGAPTPGVVGTQQQIVLVHSMLVFFYQKHPTSGTMNPPFGQSQADLGPVWTSRSTQATIGFQWFYNNAKKGSMLRTDGVPDAPTVEALKATNQEDIGSGSTTNPTPPIWIPTPPSGTPPVLNPAYPNPGQIPNYPPAQYPPAMPGYPPGYPSTPPGYPTIEPKKEESSMIVPLLLGVGAIVALMSL